MTTFTERPIQNVLTRLKAVADEKRLRILTILGDGEQCVCELQHALGVGQSLLSFHLRVLKEAGLVTDRREGRWAYYTLERDTLTEMGAFLGGIASEEHPFRPTRRCE